MSNEIHNKAWTDIVDKNNFFQSGLAILYRNPKINPSFDSTIYDPSNHTYSLKPGSNYLFDTVPIAFGFTAFIGHDEIVSIESSLKSDLKNPKAIVDSSTYYQNYSKILFNIYSVSDKRKARPKSEKRLEIDFYNDLLKNESNYLLKSDRFYSEFQNDNDRLEKENLGEYVDAFLNWIEEKIIDLNPNENQIKGLGGLSEQAAEYIYREFLGHYIHSKTKKGHFVAVFQNRILPDGWTRIEWIGDQANKAALFSFFDQVFGKATMPRVIKKYFKVAGDNLLVHHRTVTEHPEIKKILEFAKTIRPRR